MKVNRNFFHLFLSMKRAQKQEFLCKLALKNPFFGCMRKVLSFLSSLLCLSKGFAFEFCYFIVSWGKKKNEDNEDIQDRSEKDIKTEKSLKGHLKINKTQLKLVVAFLGQEKTTFESKKFGIFPRQYVFLEIHLEISIVKIYQSCNLFWPIIWNWWEYFRLF